MGKIVKTYTLRQLWGLHKQYMDSRFTYEKATVKTFLTWLQDYEDRADERTERFFRRVS